MPQFEQDRESQQELGKEGGQNYEQIHRVASHEQRAEDENREHSGYCRCDSSPTAISMRPGKLLETLKEIDRNPEQDDQSNDSRQRGDDRLDESVSPDGAETERTANVEDDQPSAHPHHASRHGSVTLQYPEKPHQAHRNNQPHEKGDGHQHQHICGWTEAGKLPGVECPWFQQKEHVSSYGNAAACNPHSMRKIRVRRICVLRGRGQCSLNRMQHQIQPKEAKTMKGFLLAFTLATCSVMAMAQSTPMVTAAGKLQADIAKALPASTLSADEKSQMTADATQLVTNANLRAKGETPDRSAGRAAGMDIGKKVSSGKLQKADAELIQQDLKALQAAAQQ